jgi:hypothetical protein
MIYSDSRYADGYIYKAQRPIDGSYQINVDRVFPTMTANFYYYEWVAGDRVDTVAYFSYGNSSLWTRIADFNPEILDFTSIAPGTTIRIPYV